MPNNASGFAKLSSGAQAGVIITILIVCFALIAFVALVVLRHRKQREAAPQPMPVRAYAPPPPPSQSIDPIYGTPMAAPASPQQPVGAYVPPRRVITDQGVQLNRPPVAVAVRGSVNRDDSGDVEEISMAGSEPVRAVPKRVKHKKAVSKRRAPVPPVDDNKSESQTTDSFGRDAEHDDDDERQLLKRRSQDDDNGKKGRRARSKSNSRGGRDASDHSADRHRDESGDRDQRHGDDEGDRRSKAKSHRNRSRSRVASRRSVSKSHRHSTDRDDDKRTTIANAVKDIVLRVEGERMDGAAQAQAGDDDVSVGPSTIIEVEREVQQALKKQQRKLRKSKLKDTMMAIATERLAIAMAQSQGVPAAHAMMPPQYSAPSHMFRQAPLALPAPYPHGAMTPGPAMGHHVTAPPLPLMNVVHDGRPQSTVYVQPPHGVQDQPSYFTQQRTSPVARPIATRGRSVSPRPTRIADLMAAAAAAQPPQPMHPNPHQHQQQQQQPWFGHAAPGRM